MPYTLSDYVKSNSSHLSRRNGLPYPYTPRVIDLARFTYTGKFSEEVMRQMLVCMEKVAEKLREDNRRYFIDYFHPQLDFRITPGFQRMSSIFLRQAIALLFIE